VRVHGFFSLSSFGFSPPSLFSLQPPFLMHRFVFKEEVLVRRGVSPSTALFSAGATSLPCCASPFFFKRDGGWTVGDVYSRQPSFISTRPFLQLRAS